MRYTKNIGLKLKNLGFEFKYSIPIEETNNKFDVYGFKHIEVNVNNETRKIDFELNITEFTPLFGVKNLNDLIQLKKLMYNQ
jgi:hypothetical protein